MFEDEKWYELQRKKFADRLQNAIDEEFSRTHDLIMENLVPKEKLKDKGTMRNINNYRMKLWCDCLVLYRSKYDRESSAHMADHDLKEFDKRFNQ